MRFLALTHRSATGPARIGELLAERNHRLDLIDPAAGQSFPDSDCYDGVFVFGGGMMVYDDERWLAQERAYMCGLVSDRCPLLGVCLGAQQLALAHGGDAAPLEQFELGPTPIRLTGAATDDRLFGELPERFPALESHRWGFSPPPQSVLLAESDNAPQAFRLGDAAWGVQFHPEIDAVWAEHWRDLQWHLDAGWPVERLQDALREEHMQTSTKQLVTGLMDGFLTVCADESDAALAA